MSRKRTRRNAFAAKPAKFRGRGMHGTISHPGFHTTSRYGVACNYANAKVDDLTPTEWTGTLKPGWNYSMPDYPVVVSLVMNGLRRLSDYDAFEYWAGPVKMALDEFAQYGKGESVDDFARFIEDGEPPDEDPPHNATDALCLILDGYPSSQAGQRILGWLEAQPDPGAALQRVLVDPADPVFLMHVTQQYRYVEDVHEARICSVDYMRPFFDHLFPHYDDPEWDQRRLDERIANIEAAGYAVVTLADVYDNNDPTVTRNVYSVPPENVAPYLIGLGQEIMPWGTREPRVEHHGTSYRNLCGAAPGLARSLPEPPPPYEAES